MAGYLGYCIFHLLAIHASESSGQLSIKRSARLSCLKMNL